MSDHGRRAGSALVGAVTADAAALGLHWLYDAERVAEVGGDAPEFRPPRAEDFAGVAGYFAHPHKRPGDLSQYGTAALLAARAVVQEGGVVRVRALQTAFVGCFGPGGAWHGYMDHPTRGTLDNLVEGRERALEAGAGQGASQPDDLGAELVRLVTPLTEQYTGDELAARAVEAAKGTHDEPGLWESAAAIAKAMDEAAPRVSGVSDQQLPALNVVPAVVAAQHGAEDLLDQVEAAVRITHDDDLAVGFARTLAQALAITIDGQPPVQALETAADRAARDGMEQVAESIASGLEASASDAVEAAGTFGRACPLVQAVPVVAYLVKRSSDFKSAARANILAGGDSCGRAVILGALLGAAHGVATPRGVPLSWFSRLHDAQELAELAEAIARA